jgi:hypothetical protein
MFQARGWALLLAALTLACGEDEGVESAVHDAAFE